MTSSSRCRPIILHHIARWELCKSNLDTSSSISETSSGSGDNYGHFNLYAPYQEEPLANLDDDDAVPEGMNIEEELYKRTGQHSQNRMNASNNEKANESLSMKTLKEPKKVLTNTERSRKRRQEIYQNKQLYEEYRQRERDRKNSANYSAALMRKESQELVETYRKKEREKKRKYREKKRTEIKPTFTTPEHKEIKKINKVIQNLSQNLEKSMKNVPQECSSHIQTSEPQLIISDSMSNLHPKCKSKTDELLSQDFQSSKRKNPDVRNDLESNEDQEMNAETISLNKIKEFFDREDVSVENTGTEKLIIKSENPSKISPIRYRFSTLKTLFEKFCAEVDCEITYQIFCRNVPPYIVKPIPSAWETCYCRICLNPELKLECLAKLTNDESLLWNENNDDNQIDKLVEKILQLQNNNSVVQFIEWKKVSNVKSKIESKINVKRTVSLSYSTFKNKLEHELKIMKEHLIRVYAQYKSFKNARECAQKDPGAATIQAAWSENAKIQPFHVKNDPYYQEEQIAVHTAYIWTTEEKRSVAALSDCTNYNAAAVIVSLREILSGLVEQGKKTIYIVTDSRSRYRNKKIFWLIQQFAIEYKACMTWIYLEPEHGRGMPEGINTIIRHSISDMIMSNPDLPLYSVRDLLIYGFEKRVLSIFLYYWKEDDVNYLNNKIPMLNSVKDTNRIHEVQIVAAKDKFPLLVKDTLNSVPRKVTLSMRRRKSSHSTCSDDNDSEDELWMDHVISENGNEDNERNITEDQTNTVTENKMQLIEKKPREKAETLYIQILDLQS
ncbi:hypothetical protein GQR58_019837 [Nymphon striatum]|nr:hypothetical protein GQR58_019837 [Nymphon striatum]